MRNRPNTSLAAVFLTLGGLAVSAGPAAADPASCYGWNTHPDVTHTGGVSFGNGTNIRRGPDTSCDSHGLGYPSHGIDVHCHVYNASGYGWAYVRNLTTGVSGWARINTLNVSPSAGIGECW